MRNERVSGGDPFQAGVFRVDPRRNIVSCAGRETHLAPKVIDALAFLAGLFAGVGIKLIDFKVEFGRHYEGDLMRLIVADEISPDSCRLWDMETGDIMDKDQFRKDLGNVTDAYREVAKRLGVLRENENAGQRGPVLVSDNEK